MVRVRIAYLGLRLCVSAIALALLATVAPGSAARSRHLLLPSAALYRYEGVVYDRRFAVRLNPRSALHVRNSTAARSSSASAPYAFTDLEAVFTGNDGPLYGFPTAVNNGGAIAFYDACQCFGDPYDLGNAGILTDDRGDELTTLYSQCCAEGTNDAVPYAVNNHGYSAGDYSYEIGGGSGNGGSSFSGNITWSPYGATVYFDGADNGSVALALDDDNVSVGVDVGPKGVYAGEYRPTANGMRRILLKPPKNTRWVGVATGINDSGDIVGYATFGEGDGRAVRFFENGYAAVLPLAAAGVSTSAQAINVHGDIVGNAGSQAYLYKNNRVTILPRPPGETAGNAVAYAINASDEIVGDIVTAKGQTAFLYSGGRSYDLDSLLPANSGYSVVSAVGINDSGQIVGSAYRGSIDNNFGYSMKPRS